MKQEVIAAIVMCVMGAGLLFVPAYKIWSVTEKWKTIDDFYVACGHNGWCAGPDTL